MHQLVLQLVLVYLRSLQHYFQLCYKVEKKHLKKCVKVTKANGDLEIVIGWREGGRYVEEIITIHFFMKIMIWLDAKQNKVLEKNNNNNHIMVQKDTKKITMSRNKWKTTLDIDQQSKFCLKRMKDYFRQLSMT